eukprot:NODE_1488_length_838_cov_85.092827_g1440_i0.p1 GENE.NODE_1488_length_838_cov_85.092827_g1440_i0~~NODE_1488_length_838_cov_85.092827_g1440_i0.p1  ORF type:complete len:194 (+),score=16.89 NODE_1488_length_838_cov_85.092827_g1440_i0:106-687(+)
MVEAEQFVWSTVDPKAYQIVEGGRAVLYSGAPDKEYRTALGEKAFNSGKHFWQVHVACDNIKIGIAGPNADPSKEIGTDGNTWACNLQTGDVIHDCKEPKTPTPEDGLVTRLYKLLVPISGGIVGVVLDMEEGKVSLFFNGEYQGVMVHDPDLKSKGPIRPACGIGGLEGKTVLVQTEAMKIPKTYTYKRNKM